MGAETDTSTLTNDLNRALPLLARDALAASVAAGALPGANGVALSKDLRAIAAAELADVERLAARIASLGGKPAMKVPTSEDVRTWKAGVQGLIRMQREALDALVAAIPADADDAEGEATEHLLEHIVARKRDAVELLERALR